MKKTQCLQQLRQQVFFHLLTEESLVNKKDLLALNLSWTYCHKTGTRPPSCVKLRQLMNVQIFILNFFEFSEMTEADPELLHQLRGPKDVIMDLDFHPKSKQVLVNSLCQPPA